MQSRVCYTENMSRQKKRTLEKLRFLTRRLRQSLSVFRYSGRALGLVWTTSHTLTVVLAILTVGAGLLPGAIAYVGKLIVDTVVLASRSGAEPHRWAALSYVGLEAIAVMVLAGSQRGLSVCQSLLRVLLGQRVNVLI